MNPPAITPFELAVRAELEVEWHRFDNEWLFVWYNLNIEDRVVDVERFEGNGRISLGGGNFGDQQEQIYWQAIQRYLILKVHEIFKRWDSETASYPSVSRNSSLDAIEEELRKFVATIVLRSNDTAQRLKGIGFPEHGRLPINSTGYHSAANVEILRLAEAYRALNKKHGSLPVKGAARDRSNMPEIARDERTTAIGLFNYARSYRAAADHLHSAKLKVTHPDAPLTFLYYHAIELFLKAYLRSQNHSVEQLKHIGHSISKIAVNVQTCGLILDDEDKEILSFMAEDDNVIRSRYIVTGAFSRPEEEALSRTCAALDKAVGMVVLGVR